MASKHVTKTHAVRPLHDVFKMIDMRGGDKLQCWPYQGFMQPNQRGRSYPIWVWRSRRYQAHRIVYALKHGIHPDNVPQLVRTCNSESCCNPDHILERFSTHANIKVQESRRTGKVSSQEQGKEEG